MLEKNYKIIKASDLDNQKVDSFMELCFNKNKVDFLKKHGEWLYNGQDNRYIVLDNENPVGHFGLIPSKINLEGEEFHTLASMDLNIPNQYRGKGIMRFIDDYVRLKKDIIISFPNDTSYKIYKKYGHQVSKKNRVMFLPLQPSNVPHYKKFKNFKKILLRFLFILLEPFYFIFKRLYINQATKYSYKLENPSSEILSEIFKYQSKNIVSTIRDKNFIQWRYFDSPFFSQYDFFVGGFQKQNSIIMITRTLNHMNVTQTRVIDLFGNLDDKKGLKDLLKNVIQHSIKKKSVYMTLSTSLSSVFKTFIKSGFLPISRSNFRYWHSSDKIMKKLLNNKMHWCLSDSDNDTFD